MKRTILALAVLIAARCALGESVTIDGVAAFVNAEVVTVGEVKEAMGPMMPQLRQLYTGADLETQQQELYADVLDDLINAKLIMKAFEADTKLNKEGVEKYVEKRISEFIKDKYDGDRQEFMKTLKEAHISMEDWRRQMRERIIVGMMKSREVDAQVVISPREIRKVFEGNPRNYIREEKVRIRVIVLQGAADESERAAKAKAAGEVLDKIRAGADFADVARAVSKDGKASEGGDWGWYDLRDLRPELAKPVASLKTGAISGWIRMDGADYLVKLEGRQAGGAMPFEEVRTTIEKELRRKEIRRVTELWMTRLRKDAYIQIVKSSVP
jgi:parvulin-like peptidyl-prolyl isomerase